VTPSARISAAIEVLDQILAGESAEKALTTWGRKHRFAGSRDRAALRDHVFDALRRRRSYAALGGGETGRGIMIGALRHAGVPPEEMFTGEGHAPAPLTIAEQVTPDLANAPVPVRLDIPDWLYDRFTQSLGAQTEPALAALQTRAPVTLRVNLRRADREAAMALLAQEDIACIAHPQVRTAVQVTDNERKIQRSQAYLTGVVELQDAASQAAILRLPLRKGDRVLDHCAGGGGKALGIAALHDGPVYAHDVAPERMRDLGPRAERAGVTITRLRTEAVARHGPYDLILLDAPCSGSGTWRRAPEAKWWLTPADLARLCAVQSGLLAGAAPLIAPGGTLAYATCSVLNEENRVQVDAFTAANPGWHLVDEMRLLPGGLWDGFYIAILQAT